VWVGVGWQSGGRLLSLDTGVRTLDDADVSYASRKREGLAHWSADRWSRSEGRDRRVR
jgi:hypothetical protein